MKTAEVFILAVLINIAVHLTMKVVCEHSNLSQFDVLTGLVCLVWAKTIVDAEKKGGGK